MDKKERKESESVDTPIFGIPCQLTSPGIRAAVRQVLLRIQEKRPKDFARLQELVHDIVPLSTIESADGTQGGWERFPATPDPDTWHYGIGDTPGILYLAEDVEPFEQLALIAHEFGHACTREEDRHRRGMMPSDEWVSELSADWYAYQWGFGRDIARIRKTREHMHHGPAPGTIFEDNGVTFRVTRSFRVYRIDD